MMRMNQPNTKTAVKGVRTRTMEITMLINPDSLALETIAKNRKRASELVDEVGFDDGPSS